MYEVSNQEALVTTIKFIYKCAGLVRNRDQGGDDERALHADTLMYIAEFLRNNSSESSTILDQFFSMT